MFVPREVLCTLTDSTGPIENVALSADGRLVASGSKHLPVKLWNTQTGQLLHLFESYKSFVALSADGLLLACGDEENGHEIRLWNTQTYQFLLAVEFEGMNPFGPHRVALSADGHILASCAMSSDLNFWNAQTGEHLYRDASDFGTFIRDMALSANGHICATCTNEIRLWDVQTGSAESAGQTIKLWNAQTGELLHTLLDDADSTSISLSADGHILASGSAGQTIKLWNTQTGELLHTFLDDADSTSISLSADGQLLASGSAGQTIKLWNAQTGELLQTLTGHTGRINRLVLSVNGHILASGSEDQSIKIWGIKGK